MKKSSHLIVANLQLMAKKYSDAIHSDISNVLEGLIKTPIEPDRNNDIVDLLVTMSISVGLLNACAAPDEATRIAILFKTMQFLGGNINDFNEFVNSDSVEEFLKGDNNDDSQTTGR